MLEIKGVTSTNVLHNEHHILIGIHNASMIQLEVSLNSSNNILKHEISKISINVASLIKDSEDVIAKKLADNYNSISNLELNFNTSLQNLELRMESKLESSVGALNETLNENLKKFDEKLFDFQKDIKDQLNGNSKTVEEFMKIVKYNNKKSIERTDKFDDQLTKVKAEIDFLKLLTEALKNVINEQNRRHGDLIELFKKKWIKKSEN